MANVILLIGTPASAWPTTLNTAPASLFPFWLWFGKLDLGRGTSFGTLKMNAEASAGLVSFETSVFCLLTYLNLSSSKS